uniref:PX domain-containing protein n=1 Tax=Aplanochytrium stocchinoi TaxID=215587 RepID=A0A7S3UZN2_9STRA|mmetsp:Transcript_4781/g.5562  ORF Transcript_4781/g.5562 Transcript_4781/m.5562 type:complete len:430 (+) Transcript_4781:119-1408(+)
MGNSLSNSPIFGGGLDYVTRIWKIPRDFESVRVNEVSEKIREQEEIDLIWCKSMALGSANNNENVSNSSVDQHENENGNGNEKTSEIFHWIVMRHFESGRVLLYVDGYLRGEGHASFGGTLLKVNISPTKLVVVRISFNESSSFSYKYECKLHQSGKGISDTGKIIPENNEVLEQNHDPKQILTKVEEAIVLSSEEAAAPDQRISHSSSGIVQSYGTENKASRSNKDPVVMYQVKTSIYQEGSMGKGEPLQTVVVLRRFSDFVKMHNGLLSAFCGTHLYSNVPPLPPKHNKLFANHLDRSFIEKRRHSLGHFLSKIVTLPRAGKNPDVRIFLGLTSEFRGERIKRVKHVRANAVQRSIANQQQVFVPDKVSIIQSSNESKNIPQPVSQSQTGASAACLPEPSSASASVSYSYDNDDDDDDDEANAGSFV